VNSLEKVMRDSKTIKVGNLIYSPKFRIIASQDNSVILRYKLNSVLENLVMHKDDLVTRNELIEQIWKGNHYIGEKALTHSVCILRQIFLSLGDEKIEIVTMPKSGYCLL
jgi:DNA-binding winged helix-turn-helix (wHTH) protein